jgi:hypothetical protein
VQGCTCFFTVQQAIVALQWLVLLPSTLINFILDGNELLRGADMQVGSHMGLLEPLLSDPFLGRVEVFLCMCGGSPPGKQPIGHPGRNRHGPIP